MLSDRGLGLVKVLHHWLHACCAFAWMLPLLDLLLPQPLLHSFSALTASWERTSSSAFLKSHSASFHFLLLLVWILQKTEPEAKASMPAPHGGGQSQGGGHKEEERANSELAPAVC